MAEFEFPESFITRYKEFLSSAYFRSVDPVSESGYWKFHSDAVKLEISGNRIKVDGESGFYIPRSRGGSPSFFRRLLRLLLSPSRAAAFLKHRLGRAPTPEIRLLNYAAAFDRVMSHDPIADPDLSPYRIDFRKLRKRPECFATADQIRDRCWGRSRYEITDLIVLSYYHWNVLQAYTDPTRISRILEIGAGNGNLLAVLRSSLPSAKFVDVDLPRTLCHAILYIADLFPDASLILPHEANAENVLTADFVFLTPQQIEMLPDHSFDLAINNNSFQEMTREQIGTYFKLIQRSGRDQSYFFTSNRVEKIPCGPGSYEREAPEYPNRFSEYPWDPRNEIIVYEVCRLSRLVQLDNLFMRLERIVKGQADR